MKKNKDGDPFSVGAIAVGAATFGPPLVSSIRFLATKIHRTIQDFGSNEKDCYELSAHVNEVVGYLEGLIIQAFKVVGFLLYRRRFFSFGFF